MNINMSEKLIARGKLRLPVLTALAFAFTALWLIFTFILNFWATNQRQQDLAELVEQVDDQIYQLNEDVRYQLLSSASLLAGRESVITATLQQDAAVLQEEIRRFHLTYSSQTLIEQVQIFDKDQNKLANFAVGLSNYEQLNNTAELLNHEASATGMHLSVSGTIHIYAVVAIYHNNDLIGYIQVSKPYLDSVHTTSTLNKANLYLLIDKSLVSRNAVKSLNDRMGLLSHWNVFKRLILVSPMQGNINLPLLASMLDEVVDSTPPDAIYLQDKTEFGELSYNLALFPVTDVEGNYLGRMLLLKDISEASKAYNFSFLVTSISFGVIMSLIFVSFWYFLGRIERNISESEELIITAKEEAEAARDEAENAKRSALIASQIKSDFLAKMSHELRTPLNAIIGITEMMYEDATDYSDENYIEPLERVLRSGKHLLALINDILDLSKIEAGKMELHPETFDIKSFIKDVGRTCESLAKKHNNSLIIETDDALGELYGDTTKIRQIFLNLLSNACKFTEQGTIRLTSRLIDKGTDHVAQFAITDNGIGMDEQQLSKLFNDFQQVDSSTTRKYEGTGLGLAISRKLAKLMGGNITVTSELNKGTEFIVELPITATRDCQDNIEPYEPNSEPAAHVKLLIAENDPHMTELLKYHLQHPTVTLSVCDEPKLLLHYLTEQQPHLLVIDASGDLDKQIKIIQEINDAGLRESLVIIAICDANKRETLIKHGIEHCLIKPINKNNIGSIFYNYIKGL